ncbi:MAG: TetR/AcrR family transcriptional regulator [Gemmatimonadota bacterium]
MKGPTTKSRILDRAIPIAAREGLDGLTIGSLAAALELSKSGLFAHFRSKEDLKLSVLHAAARRFAETVARPVLSASAGLPRLRALFTYWIRWALPPVSPNGCIFLAAALEVDDRPGPVRDYLKRIHTDWFAAIASYVVEAQNRGELRADLDPAQFAFDLFGIVTSWHHRSRLLDDPRATTFAQRAFERLLSGALPQLQTPSSAP